MKTTMQVRAGEGSSVCPNGGTGSGSSGSSGTSGHG